MYEQEIEFLRILGGDIQVVSMSEGVIDNAKVIVTSSHLVGKEGYIKKMTAIGERLT